MIFPTKGEYSLRGPRDYPQGITTNQHCWKEAHPVGYLAFSYVSYKHDISDIYAIKES